MYTVYIKLYLPQHLWLFQRQQNSDLNLCQQEIILHILKFLAFGNMLIMQNVIPLKNFQLISLAWTASENKLVKLQGGRNGMPKNLTFLTLQDNRPIFEIYTANMLLIHVNKNEQIMWVKILQIKNAPSYDYVVCNIWFMTIWRVLLHSFEIQLIDS